MPAFELTLALLVIIALLAAISRRLSIPYPILLVFGGICLGVIFWIIPGVDQVTLEPDLVLVVFLPPLVFAAAWQTPVRDIRQNIRPVLLLSVGLVLFTTFVVGFVVSAFVPGLPIAAALALGAIVSPSDALAAITVLGGVAVPRRVRAVLEEESLLNDATALVTYRQTVAAATSGTFVLGAALGGFALAAAGGVVIGIGVAFVAGQLWQRLDDAPVEVSLSLVVPYAAYLPAEHFGASGVIAAVTAGLLLGRRSSTMFSSETRVLSTATWEIVAFVLNGFAFLLVGLELPTIATGLAAPAELALLGAAVAVSVAVVAARFVWVFTTLYLPGHLPHAKPVPPADDRERSGVALVVSWAGMRGAVSLAAALALPPEFPQRDQLLLLTFVVIAVTLLGQGLTLTSIVRRAPLPDEQEEVEEETLARTRAAEAGLAQLDQLRLAWPNHRPLIDSLVDRYVHMLDHLPEPDESGELSLEPEREQERDEHRAILHSLVTAERDAVIALRDAGEVSDEIMRRVERGLDLEELRLDSLA